MVAAKEVWTQRHSPAQASADGLPLPPADMRVMVAGTQNVDWFLGFGANMLETILDLMASCGVVLGPDDELLDFGCGCGRVLRHWEKVGAKIGATGGDGPKLSGTDYNPRLYDWCRRNLPFASLSLNKATPPLTYGDNRFDLIYSISVFTHLAADLQIAWMDELRRICKPGGHILITTHGDSFRSGLNETEGAAYDRGELVLRFEEASGMNLCNAFHPQSYVREVLSRGFTVEAFVGVGTRDGIYQDLWLLRKNA
ncbi:class I SAM-dependent methyltransferase [Asticcacaulis sp. BYS171W]|uniref:Class I SAM-dependent methyltransferase n=1 Tax=Asticcacaulis aquaticus TaxID=2984212 RepID=A0ABT5HPT1_9CAUL|nr:class I SAM-dependent methyltransferase [Asticcacaulis aquaticus]MDC7682069.1 class I SAM-dependent methyltransferase [Asticcacaulis aquaticus]